ncbi:MAG: oxygen-dependent coproporphyrinogen oxidase [Microscillaceae bacterium]|nr:oxygen-dependent coproporphyrinogen oxidase [Microscillaceae bacterium]
MPDKQTITSFFEHLQDTICQGLEEADGGAEFQQDAWERPGGGGGRTRVIQDGNVLEKGGVNFSAVYGEMPQALQEKMGMVGNTFYATGVSIVLHPKSPMAPIIHMNVRYFEMSGEQNRYWFGGGIDLTPHYVVKEDARYFHQELKKVCDRHHTEFYPQFKSWADDYFYIKHRKETRGIGGIFFDRLTETESFGKAQIFEFVKDVGLAFVPVYSQLIQKNRDLPFGEKEKDWQLVRRGRYVEFNLVLDQGTKFGLETDGRIESILMSLPKQANWYYNHQPEAGSKEAETLAWLKKGINWV